jgi:hypothetical protein
VSLLSQSRHFVDVDDCSRASDLLAHSPRMRHASTHPLHNEIPFELGDGANYVKQ